MSTLLTAILFVTAFLALYWVFYGQRKYNEMLNPKRNTELKAVIFDLDGVILDSFHAWFNVFNEIRKEKNLKMMDEKEFRKKVWGGSPQADTKTLNMSLEEITRLYKQLYRKHVSKSKLFPNAKEVLDKIKEKNYKIGLVTNTFFENVELTLAHHGIKEKFDVIVAGDQVEKPKPYPEAILKACEKLNVQPDETIYVGDTKNDYKAGKAAGTFVVGLNTHGDLTIGKLSDLLQLL